MKNIIHKIGDKVVALETYNNKKSIIIKGTVYTVRQVTFCPQCGIQGVCIGYSTTASRSTCRNGHTITKTDTNSYFSAARFAPLDNLHESIEEAVRSEDYELAQLLTEVHTENFDLKELGI